MMWLWWLLAVVFNARRFRHRYDTIPDLDAMAGDYLNGGG